MAVIKKKPKKKSKRIELVWTFSPKFKPFGERFALARWIGGNGKYTILQEPNKDKYILTYCSEDFLEGKEKTGDPSLFVTAVGSHAVLTLKRVAEDFANGLTSLS